MTTLTDALEIEEISQEDLNELAIIDNKEDIDEIDQAMLRAQEDYELARKTIADIVKHNMVVLDSAKAVALSTENSDQFSSYSKLADSTVKAAKELLSINKDLFAMTPAKKDDLSANTATTNITNNVLFTGTTTDLLNLLKQKELPNIIDV